MTATLPNGEERELLSITDWDFSWQEQYRYKDYIFLPAGTKLDAAVTWDNSSDNINNPNDPPIPVKWGRESDDEMGSVTLQMFAANPREFPELRQAIQQHVAESGMKARGGRLAQNANRPRGAQLKRLIEQFDKDGDGKLSPAERQAAREAFGR